MTKGQRFQKELFPAGINQSGALHFHLTRSFPSNEHEIRALKQNSLFGDSSAQDWSVSRSLTNATSIASHITLVRTYFEAKNHDHYFLLMTDGTVRYRAIKRLEPTLDVTLMVHSIFNEGTDVGLLSRALNLLVEDSTLAVNRDIKTALGDMRSRVRVRLCFIRRLYSDIELHRIRHAALCQGESRALRDWFSFHAALLDPNKVQAACYRTIFSMASYNALARANASNAATLMEGLKQNFALVTLTLKSIGMPDSFRLRHPSWVGDVYDALKKPNARALLTTASNCIPARKSTLTHIAKHPYAELEAGAINQLVDYLEAIPFPHWPPAHRIGIAHLIAQEASAYREMYFFYTDRHEDERTEIFNAQSIGAHANAKAFFRGGWYMSIEERNKIGLCSHVEGFSQLRDASVAQRFLRVLTESEFSRDTVLLILKNLCSLPVIMRCAMMLDIADRALNVPVRDLTSPELQRHICDFYASEKALDLSNKWFGSSQQTPHVPTPFLGGFFTVGSSQFSVQPATTAFDIYSLGMEFANCLKMRTQFDDVVLLNISIWVIRRVHSMPNSKPCKSDNSIVALRLVTLSPGRPTAGHCYELQQVKHHGNGEVGYEHLFVVEQLIETINNDAETLCYFEAQNRQIRSLVDRLKRETSAEIYRNYITRFLRNRGVLE
jgi:hypothetical protein